MSHNSRHDNMVATWTVPSCISFWHVDVQIQLLSEFHIGSARPSACCSLQMMPLWDPLRGWFVKLRMYSWSRSSMRWHRLKVKVRVCADTGYGDRHSRCSVRFETVF